MTNQECATNWSWTRVTVTHGGWYCTGNQPTEVFSAFYFNQRITLQYCDGFLPYINVNWSQCVCWSFCRARAHCEGQPWVWESHTEPAALFQGIFLAGLSHSGTLGSVRENWVYMFRTSDGWAPSTDRDEHLSSPGTQWESSLLRMGGSGWRREVLWLNPLITLSSVGATAEWAVIGLQKFCWEQDSFFYGHTNSQGVLVKTKQVFLCHRRLEGAQEWGTRQKQCYRWVKMKRIPSAEKATDTFFFFFKLSAARRACAFFNWRPLETFPTIKSSTPWNVADLGFHVALDFWSPLQENNAKPTDTEGLFLSWWYPFAPCYYIIIFLQSIVKFNEHMPRLTRIHLCSGVSSEAKIP